MSAGAVGGGVPAPSLETAQCGSFVGVHPPKMIYKGVSRISKEALKKIADASQFPSVRIGSEKIADASRFPNVKIGSDKENIGAVILCIILYYFILSNAIVYYPSAAALGEQRRRVENHLDGWATGAGHEIPQIFQTNVARLRAARYPKLQVANVLVRE